MKSKSILVALVSLLFACGSDELSELDKNTNVITVITEVAQIGQGTVFTYTIGTAIPVEGETKISKQASNFDVSEITVGTSGIIYQYKPKPDFLGKENVEITQIIDSGGSIVGRIIIKISITVIKD